MKRLIAGFCGVVSLLAFGVIAYFWIAAFPMAIELMQGTPFYLQHAGHQFEVSHWIVLVVLTICPLVFIVLGVLLLRRAFRRHESVA